jgi:dTDP-4-dehydrorhamnose reductase
MKILLFGRNGQLGSRLAGTLHVLGQVAAYDRSQCDLTDLARLREVIRQEQPDILINASAYTAVDQAESDAITAGVLNADAPAVMAQTAAQLGALMVHYSTDYVFDGTADTPYTEESPTNPLGVYGRTKLAGEQAVINSGAMHLVLRTAWLYSNHGRNFFRTMLRLAGERDELRIVSDQYGCPTYADLVADATVDMLRRMSAGNEIRADLGGLYHVACSGRTSWYGFARRIIELAGMSDRVRVTPITTADYPTPARRPAFSVLSGDKLARVFGLRLPDWELGLERCVAEYNRR